MLEIVAYYFDFYLWPHLYKNRVLGISSVLYWLYEGLVKSNLSETLYKPFTFVLVSAKEQPQTGFIEKYSNFNTNVDNHR